ncbi:hypothetical protein PGH07_09735 [Sulfurovum sp. zt1-1]|uniref:Uncharacterized protein n=1 Tax=Sulfurovum zhangzhouensis TaxID=3019067 RepID=A0ABT7R033_9BACT|nr:hypothetical protein [Sulfurovum zhangzhouensis]MDM5272460.1 hypothetical protein [Sulfurovum zhangzhouensis]
MQYIFISLIILFFSSHTLFAEEAPQPSTDIQKLVSQIKKAPPSEKRALMNQLKIKLRKMNEKTRKEVMSNLKSSFAHNGQSVQTPQGAQSTSPTQGTQMMQSTPPRPMPQMQQPGGAR